MLVFVGIIWAVWLVDWLFNLQLDSWGIVPRRLSGLAGVLFSPFLHAGFGHLLSNTVPLIVLLVLLMATKSDPWIHVAELIVLRFILVPLPVFCAADVLRSAHGVPRDASYVVMAA